MLYKIVRKFFRAGVRYDVGKLEPFDLYAARDLMVKGLIVPADENPKNLPLALSLSASPVAPASPQQTRKGCGCGERRKAIARALDALLR